MRISPEKLTHEAQASGFRVDVLEKVARLLGLLDALRSHPFLKDRLALKGGTALNLFLFDIPRLSVDVDLNYVGTADVEGMRAERPVVEQAMQSVLAREGFSLRRMPEGHAGGKWLLRYQSTRGQSGNLEVDLNWMFRIPLWPVVTRDSRQIGGWQATSIPVLDDHELASGKLAALLARRQARDLFDSHRILHMRELNPKLLRIGFVVYGAMNRKDWRTVSAGDIDFSAVELTRQLIPTLRANSVELHGEPTSFGIRLVEECRSSLSAVLPLTASERAFLDLVLEKGVIEPQLLTDDQSLQQRIRHHPLLEWKAFNVRQRMM
jgi:predicted nucleotidyltransferase component of viral defense system